MIIAITLMRPLREATMNNNAMKKVFGEIKSPFLDKELRDTIDGVNESNDD